MAGSELITDIDGVLYVERIGETQTYIKKLSLETAWFADDFNDLTSPEGSCVLQVREIFDEKTLTIKYDSGIELFNFGSLKNVILPVEDFGFWRFLVFAEQLTSYLSVFHTFQLYQLVINPLRIGYFKNRFIFLPTFAGVLPPVPELIRIRDPQWFHFIAPEILRTRGIHPAMFKAGDVFSLGRMFKLLLSDMDSLPEIKTPEVLCESIVEKLDYKLSAEDKVLPQRLNLLIERMCDPDPLKRPGLSEAKGELNDLRSEYLPSSVVTEILKQKETEKAEHLCVKYIETCKLLAFRDINTDLLYCDILIARDLPDFRKALNHLDKITKYYPDNYQVHLTKGDIYQKYTTHSQHIIMAVSAYQQASIFSNWDPAIQKKLFLAASNAVTYERFINDTVIIPQNVRILEYHLIKGQVQYRFGLYEEAWDEITAYFEIAGFSTEAYETGRQIALKMNPYDLLRWKHEKKADQKVNLKAAVSIVFEMNEVPELAKKFLNEALNSN
jgi:hypothetical protein